MTVILTVVSGRVVIYWRQVSLAALSRIIWLNWVGRNVILFGGKNFTQAEPHGHAAWPCWSSWRAQPEQTRLANTPPIFTARLEAETGLATGLRQCGSDQQLALTAERQRSLRRQARRARVLRCRG